MLQTASFFKCPTWIDVGSTWKRSAAKAWMSLSGNPRRPEIGIDVAGEHVLRLHVAQRLGVAGIGRAGVQDRGELGTDVAGEIGVGRLPGLGLRVMEDEVAEFGNDLLLGLAVECGDERQIDRPSLVEGDEQSFLGAPDRRDGRVLADHVLRHDGGLGGLARRLVVVLQRHDEHRVRVLAELHEVGHAADDAAVARSRSSVVLLIGP